MKKASTFSHKLLVGGLRTLAVSALMAALSIVCGKYLAFNVGPVLRFSFENLPILLTGIAFGPVAGALVGIVADLVGCLMVGYTINPLITLGAAAVGFLGGLLYRTLLALPQGVRLSVAVFGAHLVGSVLIKTWGLSAFYNMPFYLLLLWRLLNYLIVGGAEFILLYIILKNKAVGRLLESIR